MTVDDIYDAVMEYDDDRVVELIEAELAAGTDVNLILDDGLIAALDDIGEQFAEGLTFVPQMLMAAEAVQAGMNILRPVLVKSGAKPKGTVVIGTAKGDLHDIGKNLVGILLEGAGFNVIDLGTNVDADAFGNVARAQTLKAFFHDDVACSCRNGQSALITAFASGGWAILGHAVL